MQAIMQTMKVPESRELQIRLPAGVAPNDTIEAILIYGETPDAHMTKINMLKTAMNDEHFRQDLEEIAGDFEEVDAESWEV